jgi:hypothetical protein
LRSNTPWVKKMHVRNEKKREAESLYSLTVLTVSLILDWTVEL